MPDTHAVILSDTALSGLKAIALYIRRHSPQNAGTVAETILNAIDSLGLMPTRFTRVGTSRKRGSAIRAMVVRPFIVYFRIETSPDVVYVLTVRHGKRRQPKRFE